MQIVQCPSAVQLAKAVALVLHQIRAHAYLNGERHYFPHRSYREAEVLIQAIFIREFRLDVKQIIG